MTYYLEAAPRGVDLEHLIEQPPLVIPSSQHVNLSARWLLLLPSLEPSRGD